MIVSGFTFIRNAVLYDYPVVESIRSLLPLVDELIVAAGDCEDGTLSLIESINDPRIKIIHTIWDENSRSGGRVLAAETDKALAAVRADADWCIYLQADEVIHEKYHDPVRRAMTMWKDDKKIDGLLFDYLHFYGSYDYVATSSAWYKYEVRVIRNDRNIYSYRDAQGFRKENDKKLRVKNSGASVYHYGWVKPPARMMEKQRSFQKWWHDDRWMEKNISLADEFDYSGIDILDRFAGTHPAVMQDRIQRLNWHFERDISKNRASLKEKFKTLVLRFFGIDLSYRNFIRI